MADVESVLAYRNVRVNGSESSEHPDPPKNTNMVGEKFTTEMMSSALRHGWVWLNDWSSQVDPTRFDAKGFQWADSFHASQWSNKRGAEHQVKRQHFFRTQVLLTQECPRVSEVGKSQGSVGYRIQAPLPAQASLSGDSARPGSKGAHRGCRLCSLFQHERDINRGHRLLEYG